LVLLVGLCNQGKTLSWITRLSVVTDEYKLQFGIWVELVHFLIYIKYRNEQQRHSVSLIVIRRNRRCKQFKLLLHNVSVAWCVWLLSV